MKTIHEWLKAELRSEHYRLIRKYYEPFWNDPSDCNNAHEALNMCTIWSNTEEDSNFWMDIYLSLIEGTYRKPSNNIFLKL